MKGNFCNTISMARLFKAVAMFSLTPALSRWERVKRSRLFGETKADCCFMIFKVSKNVHRLFPLPAGEGQGEGERCEQCCISQKPFRSKLFLCSLAVMVGLSASAQSRTNNVPGPADYAAFSRFVTDRNIFDPNRQPHYFSTRTTRTRTRTTSRSSSAPSFSLVGTMAYEKGFFAFFSGNSDELKRTMSAPGKIAGYTVTEITRGHAVLQSADGKQKLELKVGDVMIEESGKWELTGPGDVPAGRAAATGSSSSSAATESSNGGDASAAPASTGEPNDVLKRLMEKREQESK